MSEKPDLVIGADNKPRCWWCGDDPLYVDYHDNEWGHPVRDDRTLFEKICLEGFQSGLSWITILRKRENFREAFANFNIDKVAKFDESNVEILLQNAGIVRHRGKIEATINNAKRAQELRSEYTSLSDFFWTYKPDDHKPLSKHADMKDRTTSPEAIRLSKDLKKRGWKFVGPTTMYAFMQAMGLVNDHLTTCHMHDKMGS